MHIGISAGGAILAGGRGGIGYGSAKARLGARIAVLGPAGRDAVALETAQETLRAQFGTEQVATVLADAGKADDAQRTVDATLAQCGRLDILINHAGRGPGELSQTFHQTPQKFWEHDPDGWAEIIRSNVNGPFVMARAAAPHMIAQDWGRIIGISTSRVTMVRPGFAPYGPSKAALDTMTRIFSEELRGTGVTANILAPGGATDTPVIPAEGRSGHYLDRWPADVMNEALLWLISEAADDVTAARFIGKLWDPNDPDKAREDRGAPPQIL